MIRARAALVLALLGCADPTATLSRSAAPPDLVATKRDNSYSINPIDGSIYVTVVGMRSETGEAIHSFLRRMFESADSARSERIVLDLRPLTGRDTPLLTPLIGGILRRERFARTGGLFVLTDSNSFKPTQNAAALLQRYAHPIFIQ